RDSRPTIRYRKLFHRTHGKSDRRFIRSTLVRKKTVTIPFPINVYLIAGFGAAIVTALSMPLWRRRCVRFGLVDDPGHRKIHASPIPLAGGLAVFTGMLVPLLAGIAVGLAVHHS